MKPTNPMERMLKATTTSSSPNYSDLSLSIQEDHENSEFVSLPTEDTSGGSVRVHFTIVISYHTEAALPEYCLNNVLCELRNKDKTTKEQTWSEG